MRLLPLRFAPLLLLAACTSNLIELENAAPAPVDFPGSLAAEYLGYSQSEAEQSRRSYAEHFAAKGLRASKGEVVSPDIVKSNSKVLAASRAALIELLNPDVTRTAPHKAARAQLLFDCWNQQENEKIELGEASCGEEFKQAYKDLQIISDNLEHGADSKKTIRFFEGSSELDDQEKATLKEISTHITRHSDDTLELKAYGNVKDNDTLANKRLEVVRAALIGYGVAKNRISFAKPTPNANTDPTNAKPGGAVILSNDETVQDNDKIDITITSAHLPVGGAMTRKFLAVLLGVLTVSGCSTYSLEELRQATPQGNKFQTALSKLYMDFAANEEKDYDWENSWYFADKGLLAVYGKETQPEELASWEIPEEAMAHLEKSRGDLLSILTSDNMEKDPESLARAQFFFDCWVEQQAENMEPEEIQYCRHEFVRALNKFAYGEQEEEVVVKKPPQKKTKKAVAKPAKKSIKKPMGKKKAVSAAPASTITSFAIFFDSGEAVLTATADSILKNIGKTVAGQENYEVTITNKAKDKKESLYNERYAIVKNRLIELDIKESAIHSGKQASPITPNRKIEIFLND